MEQKRLYKAIETVASKKFETDESLLREILDQIVRDDDINISGGRIWVLDPIRACYVLIFQTGNVEKIDDGFTLSIKENPTFAQIVLDRTVLADETDDVLKEKGILRYSASGVGEKIKVNGYPYYKYLLAVNAEEIDRNLLYTLNIVSTVLTSQLSERKVKNTQKNLLADIDKAKLIQRSILPDHEYSFFEYDMFGVTIPAETISGDFFDYIPFSGDETRLAVTVGDAASKGLAAAAEAMYISGAIRMACTFELKISPLMARLNNLINKIFRDDRFASLFYGELSSDKNGLFLYANAGHNGPLFFKTRTGEIEYLQSTGPLLGPAPKQKYETANINFEKGDVLIIYSDGIVEAANQDYDFYQETRLEKVIKKNYNKTPKEITYALLDDVLKFSTNDSKYQDDKTIVVIKRKNNDIS